jgi:hypothetical protein
VNALRCRECGCGHREPPGEEAILHHPQLGVTLLLGSLSECWEFRGRRVRRKHHTKRDDLNPSYSDRRSTASFGSSGSTYH